MGLFGNDKIDGMFEKAKETLKDTTDKTKKAFAESSEQMKQHNAESKHEGTCGGSNNPLWRYI